MPSVAKWIVLSFFAVCFCVWFFTPLRSPSNSQMVGEYHAEFPWGEAQLRLNSDHSFRESIRTKSGDAQELTGKWTLNSNWPAHVSLTPYWELTQDGLKGRLASSYLGVQSQGIRGVQIDLTSYGTQGFKKQ